MKVRKRDNLVIGVSTSISMLVLSLLLVYGLERITGIDQILGVNVPYQPTVLMVVIIWLVALPIGYYRFFSKHKGSPYVEIERMLVVIGSLLSVASWGLLLGAADVFFQRVAVH